VPAVLDPVANSSSGSRNVGIAIVGKGGLKRKREGQRENGESRIVLLELVSLFLTHGRAVWASRKTNQVLYTQFQARVSAGGRLSFASPDAFISRGVYPPSNEIPRY
jgi:hypothetical protein